MKNTDKDTDRNTDEHGQARTDGEDKGSAGVLEEIKGRARALGVEDEDLVDFEPAEKVEKSDEVKAAEEKAAGEKAAEEKAAEEKAAGEKAAEEKAAGEKAAEEKAAAEKAAGEVDEATEEDKKDLPEDLSEKQGQAFIRERIRMRKERDAWAKEREELARTPAEKPAEKPGDERPPMKAEELGSAIRVMDQAQRFLDGEPVPDMDDAKAQKILRLGNNVLAGVNNETLLLEVLSHARAGGYGEDSARIAERAIKELPVVQARGQAEGRATEAQQAEAQKVNERIQGAMSKEYVGWPEVAPPTKEGEEQSAESKFAVEWIKQNVDEQDNALIAGNPDVRVPKLFAQIKAAYEAQEYGKVRAERDRLKELQARGDAPLSGGGQNGGGGGEPTGSAAVKAQIEEKFGSLDE